MTRRDLLKTALAVGAVGFPLAWAQEQAPQDWHCPMDPDVRSDKPGVCPRCGMKLILKVPELVEYTVDLTTEPRVVEPNRDVTLKLCIRDPRTGEPVQDFDVVHEKLLHLFLISENLEFFAHLHPVMQSDGSFALTTRLPFGGMYRVLTDYYPRNAAPQLTTATFYARGAAPPAKLRPSLAPFQAENLGATLRTEPAQPLAGLETKLFYTLQPADGIQRYLGAWAHMLAASEDLIDLLHLHPFLANGGPEMQFNVIFPRQGLYRIWTQFQRLGVVNTTRFTLGVSAL